MIYYRKKLSFGRGTKLTAVHDLKQIKSWNKFVGVLQKDLRGQIFYE